MDIKFKDIFYEARKNPEKNPKISLQDVIGKYADDKNVYISMVSDVTDANDISKTKIGINPRSTYDTPNGIYTFPLWKVVNTDSGSYRLNLPFAEDRPFIYFLKRKGGGEHIDNINEMNITHAKEYTDDLIRYFVQFIGNPDEVNSHFLKQEVVPVAVKNARIKNTGGEFWATVRLFAGLYRDIKGFKSVNKMPINRRLIEIWIGDYGSDLGDIRYSANVFNLLFSKVMGIDSITDLGGGIIHGNEPFQAVFFKTSAFNVLTVQENKYAKNDKTQWEGGTWKDGIWENGKWIQGWWLDGVWKDGVWENGNWENGVWENGVWRRGEWENGTWKGGEWFNGTWWDGTWFGGTWYDGIWKGGIWEDGEWEGGKWEGGKWFGGTWHDGIFSGGTWKGGTWLDGFWVNGTWKGGSWIKGKIHNPNTKKWEYSEVSPPEFYKNLENNVNESKSISFEEIFYR